MSDEYPPTLAAALAVLQTRLPRIAKSETAKVVSQKGSYQYRYAGLADISAQVLPLLGAVGLAFTAKPTYDDNGRYILLCRLLHVSGESDEGVYLLPTSGTPQALGSAITYGRRYLLCAMVGVAPDEDDDGAAAEAERQQPRTAQRAPSKPAAASKPATKGTKARRPPAAEPPLPGEDATTPERAAATQTAQVTREQQTKMHAQLGELGLGDRESKLTTVGLIVGRTLTSSNELSKQEASTVIETLDRCLDSEEPPRALDAVLAAAETAEGGETE